MFARVKKSGKYQYLQIVENRKEKGKVKQRVISAIGHIQIEASFSIPSSEFMNPPGDVIGRNLF